MPRKSKKSKLKIHSHSNALHVRKINGIPVLRSHIKMNFSPQRLHVSSCKNGNFKSQHFKDPIEFMNKLKHHNMSIHETLTGKNKKTTFYHKSKPIIQGLPPIIHIRKHTRKLTPYPKKPHTKKLIKRVPKKPLKRVPKKPLKRVPKKPLKRLDTQKLFETIDKSVAQLKARM